MQVMCAVAAETDWSKPNIGSLAGPGAVKQTTRGYHYGSEESDGPCSPGLFLADT